MTTASEWLGFVRTGSGALDFEVLPDGAIARGEVKIADVMREERLARKAEADTITREIIPLVARNAINDCWDTLGDYLTGATAVEYLANEISQRFGINYEDVTEMLHQNVDRAASALSMAYGDLDSDNPADWRIPDSVSGASNGYA